MGVEICRLGTEQLQAAVDVWVRARWDAQPWLEKRMGYTDEQNLAFFRDVVCAEHEVWTAMNGKRLLGLLALADGEIDQLHVAPEFQDQGVGSALLAKARDLSPERLGLFTHQRNERARRFYEKRGFVAVRFGMSPAPENEPDIRYEWRHEQQPSPAA
jgi:ribosomal protein S18 acetylase RimI-like enzyme